LKTTRADNHILFANGYSITDNSGVVTSLVGNGRDFTVDNLTSGITENHTTTVEPLLALTEETIRNLDSRGSNAGNFVQNGSTHANFWKAYQQNVASLLSLSGFQLLLDASSKYYPIRVMDLAYFSDISNVNLAESDDYTTGLYFVSKVVRTIKGNALTTLVELSRESANMVRNDAS
jgi:hypothetical protein